MNKEDNVRSTEGTGSVVATKKKDAPPWQIYLLGLGMIGAGLIRSWNGGLTYGLTSFFICWSIVVVLYYLLVLCIAEMTSIAAFGGGSYAFVRTGISPFIGYIVGFSELIQHNFFAIASTYHIGNSITYIIVNSLSSSALEKYDYNRLEPLWFFLCYLTVLPIHLRGGTFFWTVMSSLTIITVLIVLLYIFSVMTMTDTVLDPDHMHSHHEGIISHKNNDPQEITMNVWEKLISPTWMFFGIETMTISCSKISNGRQVLPPTILAVMTTATVTSLVLIFLVYLTRPDIMGELVGILYPLVFGFNDSLNIPFKYTVLVTIIANYASLIGFSYASTNLLYSMALSGLVPEYFRELYNSKDAESEDNSNNHHHHHNEVVPAANTNNPVKSNNHHQDGIPLRALITCLIAQFIIVCMRNEYYHGKVPWTFIIAIVAASIVYMGIFAAYIQFKLNFNNLDRTFLNPFHIPGAVVGIILSILLFISAAFLQGDDSVIISYCMILFGGIVYYKCIAEKKQYFSAEEQQKFMKAYILNANKRMKRNRMKKANTNSTEEDSNSSFYNKLYYMLMDPLGYMRDAIFTSHHTAGNHNNNANSHFSGSTNNQNANSKPTDVNKNEYKPVQDDKQVKNNATTATTTTKNSITRHTGSTKVLVIKVANDEVQDTNPVGAGIEMNTLERPDITVSKRSTKALPSSSIHSTAATINNKRGSMRSSAEYRLSLNWSGRVMDLRQSRQFFEILHNSIDELDTSDHNNDKFLHSNAVNNLFNNALHDIHEDLVHPDVQEEIGMVLKLTQELPDHFELVLEGNNNNNVDIEVGKNHHDNDHDGDNHTVDTDHHHHHFKHNTIAPI